MPRATTITASECPLEATFVALIEGWLTQPEAARLHEHVQRCDACHALVDALQAAEPLPAPRERTGLRGLVAWALEDGSPVSMASREGAPAVGTIIGGAYRLVRPIGAGGMGWVYEAEHTGTGERVAVKLLHGRLPARGAPEARFRREARAASALDSPHIVRALDSGVDALTGDPFLVMEYLRGEDLQRLIDRVGPLHPDTALRVVAQALEGLAEAHAAGIVHRDIKPANLFLARPGDGSVTVKLLDFGIAKVARDVLNVPHATSLTHTGGLLGSPLYMSPEQVQNSKEVDHRADLWSMGSTLYASLAGRAPHAGVTTVGKLILAICGSPAPPLAKVAPWVRPVVAGIVHRALSIDREARYASALGMLDALRALLPEGFTLREEMQTGVAPEERAAALPVPGRLAAPTGRAGRRLAAGAAVALAAVLAALGAARARGPSPAAASAAPLLAAPMDVAPSDTVLRVAVVVLPEDAAVDVDGVPGAVHAGVIEIAGAIGSAHDVRVHKGGTEVRARVMVTERGATPVKIELPPPPAPPAAPVGAGTRPVAAPARTGPAPHASAAARPADPSVEEILRRAE
jgi:eukaryotic-like serine/threonine-protein kinase